MAPGIPIATYRLQLTAAFDFDAAARIVPYLKSLGISHVYASPFLRARSGSTHGYDIIDHNALNPELGGAVGFERLSAALKQHDLGLILDFVPNHMGVHFADNVWWLDVLEWGPNSPYAAYFDIDWDTLPFRPRPGLLLPILGTSYGRALNQGDIELRYDSAKGELSAWYYEHRLPISPERYSEILQTTVSTAGAAETAAGRQLLDIASRYRGLRRPRRQEAPEMKVALAAIGGGAEIIERGLSAYRAGPDRPAPTLVLHHLLERQHYRLADWRLATSEINYRRFFDVNSLAGLRVEHAPTFQSMHSKLLNLIAHDQLQGLRLDHIDGLRDPAGYCQRLRRLIRSAHNSQTPFYLLVEKILGEGENLPRFSGVHGTTGYEMLNIISHVLVDGNGLAALDEIWRQAAGASPDFEPFLIESKRRVIDTILRSEFSVLAKLLARIAAGHYSTRDYSADELREILEVYILYFPVYRTYQTASHQTANDRALIEQTIARARTHWAGSDAGIFDFLRDVLTLDLIASKSASHSGSRVRRFAFKIQQFTGPTMAKSLEDTAFYRYHRLLAFNEVGGNPAARALPIDEFHQQMTARAASWPHSMTTTATHDTKRGEDARARLLTLSELSGEWSVAVSRWKRMNAPHIRQIRGLRVPSLAHEYMLYQALLGAADSLTPYDKVLVERLQSYAIKAAREGKQETSWVNPHEEYEAGLQEFLQTLFDPNISREFIESFEAFATRISLLGALNSLSQLTLKATLPGVPDFYQGTELWDFSLVDPDNRRPVDFSARIAELKAADNGTAWPDLINNWRDGRLKLQWTRHLLKLRHMLPNVFTSGDYVPLTVSAQHRDHVVAYARRYRREAAIVLVTRKFAGLTDGGRHWPQMQDLRGAIDLRGLRIEQHNGTENFPLQRAFNALPVAVLPARA